ncbi:MAG TPA: hypothetical protein VGQ90_06925 [Stellaceae bacterium]|jgi:hypothetical protein|nr:hypothetical protein [Stellaceae bacterium]
MIPVRQIGEEVGEGPAGTTRHVYPASAMVGDYLRAAAGLVPTGIVFAIEPVGTVAATVLGGFAAVFGVFGLRTLLRHGTRMEMTDTELRAYGVWPRTIAWAELDRMKLGYYSTRRDRKGGWMQLQLGAGATRVTLDSRIAGFDRLARRAAAVAAVRGVALSEATIANLAALGITPAEPGAGR